MGYCISMNNSEFFVSTENVGRFFAKARNAPYEFEFDDDGNITGIEHIGHNLGDDLEMFQSIAPFVAEGSFLDMSGEDGERWKWIFKDGKRQEIRASLVWGEEYYANRKLDTSESGKRFLEFLAFDLISNDLEPNAKLAQLQLLEENGFSVVPYIYLDATKNPEQIREAIRGFDPKEYAYPVDGLIMEYDDRRFGTSLGATGHHENRMIALKWKDDPVQTRFLGVELVTTRTGMVSITGIFEPVTIDGTVVSRAYLHNLDARLHLWCCADSV